MRVLRDTMPGLVQSSSENAVQSALSSLGSDERVLGAGQHHRLLIKPDAFHVSVLFQPTLAFLGRVANILPDGLESARSASEVLDEFVLKVYLPQLEEKISLLFHHAVSGARVLCTKVQIVNRLIWTTQLLMPFSLISYQPASALDPFSRCVVHVGTLASIEFSAGGHAVDRPDQFPVRNASHDTIPSRKLFKAYRRRHHSILSAM